ncbi:uncharacterized protein [Sinocyclocheilus grahami]|uniref:uncharacterized protein isoform X1 n=2 Tax=Sinocyclocheilus grahami TaxID=75366 RepID=UPI0007AD350B|nr:PREDICTED: uncharacterized protein LOC107552664 isoform X1 [Sinocyclocheilus grahami]XP_016090100.1 PREDICTED: uncharacterized protein LOC107552664 isoform X1 [Sinocyclocheilus grahami]XP_016090107.1 PREDICTED: uncharacterized protein LOC107552664 isoform X1 [Sinocyclocheilus grahami]
MKLPHPSKSFLYLLLTFGPFLGGMPVEVNIMDTAMFTCNETCNGHVLWTFNTNNENLDVLKCVQNTCTEGDNFKNRVSLKPGTLSLTLYPVLYNDEGWYLLMCNSVFLCRVHLEALVPTTVSASVKSNVTLPCYARTEKQIADDTVNILWKKDDQTVLQVQKGITTYGSGFKGRASVSLHHYKDGDLSLNILRVTTSDKGLYRCYHRDTEEHGYPAAVTFNVTADQKFYAKKFGDNLTLDLFDSDRVKVTFTSHDAAETLVCSVTGNNPICSSDYSHRVSVLNGFLVVHAATSSDTGTFTVRDKMGEVIGVNTVTVESVTQIHHFITVSVLIGFTVICICLIIWCQCHGQSQAQQYRCSYNAVLSNVDINPEPLREPACIGLSQQETSPEPDVCPRTPVEETMPETVRTTEKQDNTEEYITTGIAFEETI